MQELGADANYVVKTKDIVGNQALNRLGYCEGDSVLHHCIDVEFCEVLIHGGADIHKRNRVGQMPLHLTVDSACTKLLIDSGAQVNALDNEGRTPLHLAYDCKCAELLIRAGANLNIKDNRGRTALQYHIEKMYSGIAEEMKKWNLSDTPPLNLISYGEQDRAYPLLHTNLRLIFRKICHLLFILNRCRYFGVLL